MWVWAGTPGERGFSRPVVPRRANGSSGRRPSRRGAPEASLKPINGGGATPRCTHPSASPTPDTPAVGGRLWMKVGGWERSASDLVGGRDGDGKAAAGTRSRGDTKTGLLQGEGRDGEGVEDERWRNQKTMKSNMREPYGRQKESYTTRR